MIKDPKSIAFYLRVSTGEQDFKSQLHAIREFCRRRRWPLPNQRTLFSEKVSGSKASRRELDRMLQACREGTFDAIVTYKADRIGRSILHMVNFYAEMKARRIRVLGVLDGVDTSDDSPGTKALRNMMTTFAEWTRETIVENVKAGLKAARAQGRYPGKPRTKQAQITLALRLRKEGKTFREIQRKTKLSIGYIYDLCRGNRPTVLEKR